MFHLENPEKYTANQSIVEKMSSSNVLAGPDRGYDEFVIDVVFETQFETALRDCLYDATSGDIPAAAVRWDITEMKSIILNNHLETENVIIRSDGSVPFDVVPIKDSEGWEMGLVALGVSDPSHPAELIGMFSGSTLVVSPEYRQQGVGKALIASRLIYDDWLPTWDHDKPGYSPMGAETVKAGLDLAKELVAGLQPALKI